MMRSVGIIAEFNPLHNGHVYALTRARQKAQADVVIAVMSGNYVQRGEPAIVDKWARAQMALSAGADVVVELPISVALQSSEQFAEGGVAVLAGLHVDAIAFGTEDASLDYAALAAKRMQASDTEVFRDYTRPYASQLADFYASEVGKKLTAPNQMLALAYAEANLRLHSPLTLVPLQRTGVQHDAVNRAAGFLSASAIRQAVFAGEDVTQYVPAMTRQLLAQQEHASWADLWPLLRYRLLTATLPELRQVDQMSEGLEYRMVACARTSEDFADFLHQVKSKRYTYARLRRLALATVLNLTRDDVRFDREHVLAHVLGFTAAGREFLHSVKKTATIPLITKVSSDMLAPGAPLYMTHRADSLYTNINGQVQNFGRKPLMQDSEFGGKTC
nr:nucleotidyltransferase [Lacticaseibacillus hulanensis]